MRHDSDQNILDRERAREEVSGLASVAVPAIEEFVNIGTHVFGAALTTDRAAAEAGFPVLTLYLHLLEMGDSLSVLLPEGLSSPASGIARSLFESLLSIEYIIEDDSDRRAAAWWVTSLNESVVATERLDVRTNRGQRFLSSIANDKGFRGWGDYPAEEFDRHYNSTEAALNNERYVEAAAEYRQQRKRRGRPPHWYSLFDGPENIQRLAERLRRGAQYDLFYRRWSGVVHPMELTRFMRLDAGYPPLVGKLRDSKSAFEMAFLSMNFLAEGAVAISDFFGVPRALVQSADHGLVEAFESYRSREITRQLEALPAHGS